MASAGSGVREVIERAFGRQDMLQACARRDLGAVILILGGCGVTQGQIAALTGISQGRLSEWARHKRAPQASSSFEAFARGLGMPAAARQALGLAPERPSVSGPGLARPARGRVPPVAGTSPPASGPVPASPVRVSREGPLRLPGLEAVLGQLDDVFAVLEAEQNRRRSGSAVRRPAWKNLVFTGGAGGGKSRAAAAAGRAYRELGVLASGHVTEVAAADLAGGGPADTGRLAAEAAGRATGGILLVSNAHDWHDLPDRGRQMLRCLYRLLTEYRTEREDNLAVILAGHDGPLRNLLNGHPSLAARFRAVIHFPGYTPGQMAAIFTALAGEAGLKVTPEAERKAAAVLARAEDGYGTGNARLAVRLLNQATEIQARRVAALDVATLDVITETDIPGHLQAGGPAPDEGWPGQYL